MVKVRHRLTRERDADADIAKKLEDPEKIAREDAASDASKEKREPFRGEFA